MVFTFLCFSLYISLCIFYHFRIGILACWCAGTPEERVRLRFFVIKYNWYVNFPHYALAHGEGVELGMRDFWNFEKDAASFGDMNGPIPANDNDNDDGQQEQEEKDDELDE